jgi:hypothetical protein
VKAWSFIRERFPPPQQFGVDLREFFQLFQQLAVVVDAHFRRLLLGEGFELELVDFAHRQTLRQKVVRAVLGAALMAMTASLAAGSESFDDRGAQAVGRDFELGQEEALALAQSQRGFALGCVYPCYVYGKDNRNARNVNQKEFVLKMRECSTPWDHSPELEFYQKLTKSLKARGNGRAKTAKKNKGENSFLRNLRVLRAKNFSTETKLAT